jgi:futalosine hydrolase
MSFKILIVSATFKEVEGLLQEPLINPQIGVIYPLFNWGYNVHLLVTGVGGVATAFCLGQIASKDSFDLWINIGLAGTFNYNTPLGNVVTVSEDCFADLGAEDHDRFLDVFALGIEDCNRSPFFEGKLFPIEFRHGFFTRHLEKLKAVTVNKAHGNAISISSFVDLYAVDIETMEGAAFFYAANLLEVPSIQIRSISNYIEPRDRSRWEIKIALENLWRVTAEILISIKQSTY